ncbi:TraR/DksA family transcriptional regulator [Pseudomonas guariconensis]|uniref:TraR/DksA family transcriptional regulator n=1 Tax=Pseudomonas guariconensis TaxID=1288410 RepID=UPI003906BFC2
MALDAESLLQQPDDQYMSEEQLAFFKQLLTDKQRELEVRIHEHEQTLSTAERVADASDAGTIEEGRTLVTRLLQGERSEFAAISAALQRIADDEFGWCEETGEPIGLARLLLNPSARLTTEAQAQVERRGRHVRAEVA